MDAAEKEHFETELKRWKYLIELFSDREGRVIINNSNVTAEYRDWAKSQYKLTESLYEAKKLHP